MNIICNNCIGARLYNVSNKIFNNPFTWCTIYPDEFIKLIKEFDIIDFYNIKVYLEIFQSRKFPSICVELENGVKLHYIHYIYKDCDFEKNHPEVYSKKIFEYFINLYYKRLDRMIKNNEKPLFLFSFNYLGKNYNNYLNIIDELKKIDKDIVIIAHNSIVKEKDDNMILLDDDIMSLSGKPFCEKIKHYFFND